MYYIKSLFTIVEQNIAPAWEKPQFKYYIYIWYKDKKNKTCLKIEIPKTCFDYLKRRGIINVCYKDFLNGKITENKLTKK